GTAFLTDFGLAREVESSTRLTMSGAIMGTPSYMSPEQARGHGDRVDHRTDLYSLGAVLYEGLTGRPPFDGKDLIGLLESILRDDPAPPTSLVPEVPRDVETITLKALDKEPDRRYSSGADFAADIDRFLTGGAIEARRSGAIEKGARWAKRRPALIGSVGAALAVALVAGVVIWRGSVNASEERRKHEQEIADAAARDRKDREERERVATAEREAFELKLKELEAKLANASTDEDKARILREIEAAKTAGTGTVGPETGTPPVTPPHADPAWKSVDAQIKPLLDATHPGDALALLEKFDAKTPEDRGWKETKSREIRDSVDHMLKTTGEEAARHEAAGAFDKAIESWTWVAGWHVAECTAKAEAEIERLKTLTLTASRETWRKDRLPVLRRSVAAALASRDLAAARAAIEAGKAEPLADEASLADLEWVVERFDAFWISFRSNAADKDLEIDAASFKGEVHVLSVAGEDSLMVRLPNKAEIPVSVADVDELSIVQIVRRSAGDEDGVALFWWFPPLRKDKRGVPDPKDVERAAKEAPKNQERALEVARKSQNSAKLLAFFNALKESATPVHPPIDPGTDTPPGPGVAKGPWAVTPEADAKLGMKWAYGFATPAEAGDWMTAAKGPPEELAAWGVRLEKKTDGSGSQLWLCNAQAGWVGSMGHVLKIRAQGTLLDGKMGRFGITLGGYQAWVTAGQFLWSETPSGKSNGGNIDIKKPALNRVVTLEMWLEEGTIPQLHVSVDGVQVQQVSVEEEAHGPTGVFADGGTTAAWDSIEVFGRVGAQVEEHLAQYRNFVTSARDSASSAKVLSDGKSMGTFQTQGEGRWFASEGVLRGHSAGTGPRQDTILRGTGARNFRLKFRYAALTGKVLMLEARGGPGQSALHFMLPLDQPNAWREVTLVAAERCVWCLVDGTLPLFLTMPPEETATGEIAFVLNGGDAAVDDIALQEVPGLSDGAGPSHPWPALVGTGGPGPGPGPGADGWTEIFDKKTTANFAKKEKLSVKNGELWVTSELETAQDWPAIEMEVVFACEQPLKFGVGVKNEWVAKVDVPRGRHTLYLMVRPDSVEVRIDDHALPVQGGQGKKSGPFRLKLEGGGPLKVIQLHTKSPPR
ncbi:MAG: protein kinase, partial [Planctomycetes bacterium]|nr:protein kinase [Planctomycetota bacterium]